MILVKIVPGCFSGYHGYADQGIEVVITAILPVNPVPVRVQFDFPKLPIILYITVFGSASVSPPLLSKVTRVVMGSEVRLSLPKTPPTVTVMLPAAFAAIAVRVML